MKNLQFMICDLQSAPVRGRRSGVFFNRKSSIIPHQSMAAILAAAQG